MSNKTAIIVKQNNYDYHTIILYMSYKKEFPLMFGGQQVKH